jgi:hypothetical protein
MYTYETVSDGVVDELNYKSLLLDSTSPIDADKSDKGWRPAFWLLRMTTTTTRIPRPLR